MKVPEINLSRLHQYYHAFSEFVESKGEIAFKSFSHPYLAREEGYKSLVRQQSRERLDVFSWEESDIGSGRIIAKAIQAIEQPQGNNLVQTRQWISHEQQRYHRFVFHE